MGKIYNLLKSKQLAVYLLIALTLTAVLGMIIPQEELFPEIYQAWIVKYSFVEPIISFLQLNRVFYSAWFITLSIAFLVNLSACTYERVLIGRRYWKHYSDDAWVEDNFSLQAHLDSNVDQASASRYVDGIMRAQGYKLTVDSTNKGYAKHRLGFWGVPLFHIGLVIVILAALVSAYFKLTGYMMLGEGEVREENHEYYAALHEAPLFNEQHSGFSISLLKQDRVYNEDNKLDYVKSNVVIEDRDGTSQQFVVEKGQPAEYKDYRIFHYDAGFAPLLQLTKGSQALLRTYFLLTTEDLEVDDRYYTEDFNVPNAKLILDVEYFPARDEYIVQASEASNVLFAGTVKAKETVAFGDYTLNFGEMRYWTGFEIVKDSSATWLFLGAWIGLVGLIMLYLLVPKFWVVTISTCEQTQKTKVLLKARSLKYQRIFKEDFEQLVSKISEINTERVANVD